MSAVRSHDWHLFAPLQAQEVADARAEAIEAATAERFASLIADDDAIYAAWSCEDEVATAVCPLAALRESDPAKRAEMALAFLDGMAQACRDRLWKQAAAEIDSGERCTPLEPQTELVRAARAALTALDGSTRAVTPGVERRLRKSVDAFKWIPA